MISGCQGMGDEEKWEVTANRYRVSLRGDENVLKLGGGDGCTTQWIY